MSSCAVWGAEWREDYGGDGAKITLVDATDICFDASPGLHYSTVPLATMDDSEHGSKLLDDIFADVDANENPDAVANSCDEESDLDEPKPLPPTPAPAIPAAVHARVAPGVARGTPPRRPLGPATTTRSPGLLRTPAQAQRQPPVASMGGDGGESEYWMVQW